MSEAAPRPNIARAMLALALTDLLVYGVADIVKNILLSGPRHDFGRFSDWWLNVLIVFPIFFAPAPAAGLIVQALLAKWMTRRGLLILEILVSGLATSGFMAYVSIIDQYFTKPGLDPSYAVIGFVAGALWGAIYVGLLPNQPRPSP